MELLLEARRLAQALKRWTEALHGALEIAPATRDVLELLLGGAKTVPTMARARGVSRQHVQPHVDALVERGWVVRRPNPAHKRSPLIALTDAGRAVIQGVRAEELDALYRLQPGVSDDATSEAAQVLAAWRAAIERDQETRSR